MMKLFCMLLVLFLSGCADRYSLDENRGPDPKGIVTNNPLSLPPDYLLRAPEQIKKETSAAKTTQPTEKETPAITEQTAVPERKE